jgi:hypothetical protein
MALTTALKTYDGPALLIDGDTYFRCSPDHLFRRITPEQSVMHVMEGYVGHLRAVGHARHRLSTLSVNVGVEYQFAKDTPMWNSGVVGVHPARAGVLEEAVALCDALHAAAPSWISEQLAFSSVLRRHTRVRESRDVIFHYHPRDIRTPFRQMLPILMSQYGALPPFEKASALYVHRPRPSSAKRWKARAKRVAKPLGFFKHDLETSV